MKTFSCPDCGFTFQEGEVPASCPNCGCPSEFFKQHTENIEINNTPEKEQKKGNLILFLIITLCLIALGVLYYNVNDRNEKAAEKARQEQYEREQAEQRERIKRETQKKKEQEEQNLRRKEALCENKWKYTHGDPYGQCMVETVGFNIDGTAWCSMAYYAGGNKIKTSSFDFTYSIKGDYIYVQGDKAYYYDGYSLELWPSGERFREVSRWDF